MGLPAKDTCYMYDNRAKYVLSYFADAVLYNVYKLDLTIP